MRLSKILCFVSGKHISWTRFQTNLWLFRKVICHLSYFTWELGWKKASHEKKIYFSVVNIIEPKFQDKSNQELPNQDLEHFIINYVSTYPSIHVLMDFFVTG